MVEREFKMLSACLLLARWTRVGGTKGDCVCGCRERRAAHESEGSGSSSSVVLCRYEQLGCCIRIGAAVGTST